MKNMRIFEFYKLLSERQMNEDRVVAERVTVGCLVNSILIVAFFSATETAFFNFMRFVLPISGLLFSFGLIVILCIGSHAMISYYNALHKLEKKSDFNYMKEQGLRPFTDLSGMSLSRRHIWKLGFYVAPLFISPFIVIWFFLIFG